MFIFSLLGMELFSGSFGECTVAPADGHFTNARAACLAAANGSSDAWEVHPNRTRTRNPNPNPDTNPNSGAQEALRAHGHGREANRQAGSHKGRGRPRRRLSLDRTGRSVLWLRAEGGAASRGTEAAP